MLATPGAQTRSCTLHTYPQAHHVHVIRAGLLRQNSCIEQMARPNPQVLSSDRQRQLYDLKLDGRLGRVMAPDPSSPCAPCPSLQICRPALNMSCCQLTRTAWTSCSIRRRISRASDVSTDAVIKTSRKLRADGVASLRHNWEDCWPTGSRRTWSGPGASAVWHRPLRTGSRHRTPRWIG